MKIFFGLLIFCFTNNSYTQNNILKSIGMYEIEKENNKMALNICENNKWYFASCYLKTFLITHRTKEPDCNLVQLYGNVEIKDSLIFLKNNNEDLVFSFLIVDSLNFQVIYSNQFIEIGDFLNRRSSFFNNYFECEYSFFLNDFNSNWVIFKKNEEDENEDYFEILKFENPGFI